MIKVKRATAIARLRRDCTRKEEVLHISRSMVEEVEFGELYISSWHNNSFVDSGSLTEVLKRRKLLREDEEVEGWN